MSAGDSGVRERFDGMRRVAALKPHGTRARYVAGRCRCMLCRAANSRYSVYRDHARRQAGDERQIVSAARARAHIVTLSKKGVGYKTVADVANVAETIVFAIRSGRRKQVRKNTATAILSVTAALIADRALVDAGPTWEIIRGLIEDGYSKTQLAAWLGSKAKVPALQIGALKCTAAMALRVEKLAAEIAAGKRRRDR